MMGMLVKNGIGLFLNQTLPYFMIDSEQAHQENRRKFGPQWHWHDREFSYKINDLGYRMNKNMDQVDLDNYILFLGCSFTFGLGIPLEDTYAHRISQALNLDYINAGMCSTGVDFAYYNFMRLFATVGEKLPSYVVVNWPDSARACYWEDDPNNIANSGFSFFLPQYIHNKNSPWAPAYFEFITRQKHIDGRFDFYRQSMRSMCEMFGVKYYELTCCDDPRYPDLGIPGYGCNRDPVTGQDPYSLNHGRNIAYVNGRYISHPGPAISQRITDDFLSWAKTN